MHGRVCARTRLAEQIEDAGRVAWQRHASGRGRRAAKRQPRHPRARGRGIAHLGRLKSTSRITFAGTPAAITPAGMSRVTTEFEPITERSPISMPPVTTQLTPNQQLEPMRTGPCGLKPCQVTGL